MLAEPTISAPLASMSSLLPIAIILAFAVIVLTSIALDLRRLRRASRLRPVHTWLGVAFTGIVVGGTLAMSITLGAAPSATAGQPDATVVEPQQAPAPESIDRSDITDAATDIQLPTLPAD